MIKQAETKGIYLLLLKNKKKQGILIKDHAYWDKSTRSVKCYPRVSKEKYRLSRLVALICRIRELLGS